MDGDDKVRVLAAWCPRCLRVAFAVEMEKTTEDAIGRTLLRLPVGTNLSINLLGRVPTPACQCDAQGATSDAQD